MILIFAIVGLLFWNIRQVCGGVKGSLIAGAFLVLTFGSFLLSREGVIFSYLQAVMLVWICQALWMFLVWDVYRVGRRIYAKTPLAEPVVKRQAGFIFGASFALMVVFLCYGIPHNEDYKLRFKNIELTPVQASKDSVPHQSFTAIFFSDIHLDALSNPEKLERMVTESMAIRPDFVLFGGDLADIHDSLLTKAGYDTLMNRLVKTAKIGAVAIEGNHEAFMEKSGSDPVGWLRRVGFTVLEDSSACFPDSTEGSPKVCFTGRVDFQVARSRDVPRKPLADLVPSLYKDSVDAPWILMDHQPKGIEEGYAGRLPDFALSGHTHDGQFFPLTSFIGCFWRIAYGEGELDGVKWLVSSGVDSWGPPVRVGSDTEMWVLRFEL